MVDCRLCVDVHDLNIHRWPVESYGRYVNPSEIKPLVLPVNESTYYVCVSVSVNELFLSQAARCPSRSIIEHVWDQLELQLRPNADLPDIVGHLRQSGGNFPQGRIELLYDSLSRRIGAQNISTE